MLLIRSQIYNILMYLFILIIGLGYTIPTLINKKYAFIAINRFAQINRFLLKTLCNIECELRGNIPKETAIICSKHMSFLDIVMLAEALEKPKFIMKNSLRYAPILGFYARQIGATPVLRNQKGRAIDDMLKTIEKNGLDGQLVIYPQGTRVLPGQTRPYKRGAFMIYQQYDAPVYLVATNVGVLWPRRSLYRYPGLAVLEFLDTKIEAGLDQKTFMQQIETEIEDRSNALMDAYPAYYQPDNKPRTKP